MYGGYYEFGKKQDMKLTQITRARYKLTTLDGIPPSGISYDPVSGDVLLLLTNGMDHHLAKVDPCKNERIEEKDIYFALGGVLYAGPFALYDSEIYYVAWEHRLVENRTSLRASLTVRKVTGCQNDDQTFMNLTAHDRPECSVEVAKILDVEIGRDEEFPFEDYVAESMAKNIKPVGSTLLAVKKDNKMHFFVQVANPLYLTSELKTFFIQ